MPKLTCTEAGIGCFAGQGSSGLARLPIDGPVRAVDATEALAMHARGPLHLPIIIGGPAPRKPSDCPVGSCGRGGPNGARHRGGQPALGLELPLRLWTDAPPLGGPRGPPCHLFHQPALTCVGTPGARFKHHGGLYGRISHVRAPGPDPAAFPSCSLTLRMLP